MARKPEKVTICTKATPKKGSKTLSILKTAQDHPELTMREVAAIEGCDHSNVVRTLQRYGIDRQVVHDFVESEKEIRAEYKRRLLTSITDDEIKKMSVHNRVVDYGILVDKDRDESKAGGDIKVVINIGDPTRVIDVEATPS